MARERPGQQPGRIAATAHFQHTGRLGQAADTAPGHNPERLALTAPDGGSERLHGGGAAQHLGVVDGHAGDTGLAHCQPCQHHRPPADQAALGAALVKANPVLGAERLPACSICHR